MIFDLYTDNEGAFVREDKRVVGGPFSSFDKAWKTCETLATRAGNAIYTANPNYEPQVLGGPVVSAGAWVVRE